MKPVLLERFNRTIRHLESEPCRNCGTHYNGKFCPECGQEADTGAPTAVGFIYEFLTRNVLEKGKLPRTLWHLLRYPGGLTVDFLEGRRARYIRPVRLYLILSILYFLLLPLQTNKLVNSIPNSPARAALNQDAANAAANTKAAGIQSASATSTPSATSTTSTTSTTSQRKVQASVSGAASTGQQDGVDEMDASVNDLDFDRVLEKVKFKGPMSDEAIRREIKKRYEHFQGLTQQEQAAEVMHGVINQAPKAMFFLVPVFALLLKMLFVFRGIPYGAHLLFSVHYHAFIFLISLVMLLPMPVSVLNFGIFAICLYLPLALRSTYACSWLGALARCFLISILYSVAVALALIGTLIMAVVG
ncbi:MAG: hypothetical protein RL748_4230 [Pseudomonadota bacterium]